MIDMHKLSAGLLLFLLAGTLTLCSSGNNFKENYEGFMGHTLRVYAKVELPDEEKEYSKKEVEAFLKKEAEKRAFVLVTGFFQVHYHEMMKDPRIVPGIIKALKKDAFVKRTCDDRFCAAFVDYNLKNVFDIIKEKNRATKKPEDKKPEPGKSEKDEKKESGTS